MRDVEVCRERERLIVYNPARHLILSIHDSDGRPSQVRGEGGAERSRLDLLFSNPRTTTTSFSSIPFTPALPSGVRMGTPFFFTPSPTSPTSPPPAPLGYLE